MLGGCDPAERGDAHNVTTLQSGVAFIEVLWDWDGVSTPPLCDGPLVSAHGVNAGAASRWAHFQGRSGNPKVLELTPGLDVTLTPAQLHPRGFDLHSDMVGVTLTDSAATP